MWTIETDGPALEGKKLWLRPGKKFLFGRSKGQGGDVQVDDKTISRKHMTVEVEDVKPGACANAGYRTKLTLTDLGAKIGTLVDGEQIRGKSHILQSDVNAVTLGKYPHRFIFTWVPVSLSFSFTSKELKSNPYTHLYNLLGPLDIRVLEDYTPGVTTHLVAKKRNTSKGLQALIDGKYIVHNDTFIQALVAAATPSEDGGAAPLEEDFDANFPNPLDYLPPKGEEPTARGEDAYAPNPNRQGMFDGYTFIFYEQRQFNTLLAPITDGRGKALLREVTPEETTVDDFVRYVKQVAGEKGLGEFEDGSEGKGVVVVRFNPVKGAGTEWYGNFGTQVSLHLDHRFVEQNEFLDAILGTDAKVLRRPLLEAGSSCIVAPNQTPDATATSSHTLRGSNPNPPPVPAPTPATDSPPAPKSPDITSPEPPRRGRSRRTARSQFKGFDDDFTPPINMSSIPEAESISVDPPAIEESQSQGLFVTQNSQMEIEREPSLPLETKLRSSRRRGAATQNTQMGIDYEPSPPPETQARSSRRRRAVSQDIQMDLEPSQPPESQTISSQKRPAPPIFDDPDNDEEAGRLAPAAAALKRRRLEETADRRRRGVATPPPPAEPMVQANEQPLAKTAPKRKAKKQDMDVNVEEALDHARQQREEAEALAKAEREALQEQFKGMDITDIRKLVQVEEMEVGRTLPPPQRTEYADASERWDDKWNGRKNFKRFRRRGVQDKDGDRSRDARRINKVIVPLEEVKRREFGIGDEYWGENNVQLKSRNDKGKTVETQDTSQSHASSPPPRAKPKPKPKPRSENAAARAARILVEELSEDEDGDGDGNEGGHVSGRVEESDLEIISPPATRVVSSSRSQKGGDGMGEGRDVAMGTATATGSRKRAAATMLTRRGPAKKVKQVGGRQLPEEESEEDSDDDLKFKFKRRRG